MVTTLIERIVDGFFQFVYFLLIARVVLSWVPSIPNNAITTFIYQTSDIILKPIQAMLPSQLSKIGDFGIDLSPFFAFMILNLSRKLLVFLLGN